MPTEQGGQLPHCDTEPSPPLERSGKGINYWFEDLGSRWLRGTEANFELVPHQYLHWKGTA